MNPQKINYKKIAMFIILLIATVLLARSWHEIDLWFSEGIVYKEWCSVLNEDMRQKMTSEYYGLLYRRIAISWVLVVAWTIFILFAIKKTTKT